MLLPVVLFFGLEGYLGKYDQHSKYLDQLKDRLLLAGEVENRNSDRISSIISDLDEGNFSEAGLCLQTGRTASDWCNKYSVKSDTKKITAIDVLKGGYTDRVNEYLNDYRENVLKKKVIIDKITSFDFEYNLLSYNDIEAWSNFNQSVTARRYTYYSPTQSSSFRAGKEDLNAGIGPNISYSNVAPIAGGRFRILAISDSFGVGHGLISNDDTWPRELERQLNLIEDRYEVVVLAQNGAGYKEFLGWVEGGYIKALDPDLVLLSYFGNDFNLLRDFESEVTDEQAGGLKLEGLDKELSFYLRCFEEEDDFFGRGLKKANKFFPSIYRFYKFSSCGEEISKLDSTNLIDKIEVVASYDRIDTLIKVPIYLYKITKNPFLDEKNKEILGEINQNGLNFINNPEGLSRSNKRGLCGISFIKGLENCEEFIANKFNDHFNRYYFKGEIKSEIKEIKNRLDYALTESAGNRESFSRTNNGEAIIVDYLPNTLFVSNESRERSSVGLFMGVTYGYGRSSSNFCVPFDRKGVVLNFNRYLTEGRVIKISSEFQVSGLGLVSRGYNKEGKLIYGKAVELKPGAPVTFMGGESVRGVVVLSNNKDCSGQDIDIADEFLLEVEIL